MKTNDLPNNIRDRMRQVFNECYKAVQVCENPDTGRRRWELFKELPDCRVRIAPSYTRHAFSLTSKPNRITPTITKMIRTPIALSHLRKRAQGSYYKDVAHYHAEWKLLFDNTRTYNVEGSLVYINADEMEKVLDATFRWMTIGRGLACGEPPGLRSIL